MDDIVRLAITLVLAFVVLAIAIAVYVIVKHRVPLKGILALGAAVIYVISPVDLAPEALLGPLGLVDDVGFFTAAIMYARRVGDMRRAIQRARRG